MGPTSAGSLWDLCASFTMSLVLLSTFNSRLIGHSGTGLTPVLGSGLSSKLRHTVTFFPISLSDTVAYLSFLWVAVISNTVFSVLTLSACGRYLPREYIPSVSLSCVIPLPPS